MMVSIRKRQKELFMDDNKHLVYILKCKDNTLYTGYTNDLAHRLQMHSNGKGAKYTRGRGPFEVMLVEKFTTKEEAMQREYQIKKMSRIKKMELIDRNRKGGQSNENPKKF